ncbi:MAG: TIGR03089 family protein [Actinomycetes bacterium]
MTFTTSHLPAYLQNALSSDPARPRLTYYDDVSTERVELSAQTLANWVIKTMNLLVEDVGVEAEARVSLHLPAHWLTAVWLIAADGVGAHVDVAAPNDGMVELPGRDDLQDFVVVDTGLSLEVFAVSLAPMAMPLGAALPANSRDFCAEVRTMPDQLTSLPEVTGTLNEAAVTRAAQLDLRPGDRVAIISGAALATLSELVEGLLAPLTVDGSAVWTRNPDPTSCVSRWESELVTAVAGPVPVGVAVPPEIRHLGLSTG